VSTYFDHVNDAAEWLRARMAGVPTVGVVLGSGLGAFAETLQQASTLP
jgi:hypothetical protein